MAFAKQFSVLDGRKNSHLDADNKSDLKFKNELKNSSRIYFLSESALFYFCKICRHNCFKRKKRLFTFIIIMIVSYLSQRILPIPINITISSAFDVICFRRIKNAFVRAVAPRSNLNKFRLATLILFFYLTNNCFIFFILE